MLVKFFRRGNGAGSGPINYLLGRDRVREDAKLLYGDPIMTEQLINTTPYKQKYKSGVLSFTEPADYFTEQQKFDIMQRFEATLFVGLEPDQYDILWVEHSDKGKEPETDESGKPIEGSEKGGRLELNFVIPCQELRSGKSLQPFYAGADLVRVNALKNIINHEYGLTDPDDPARKRALNPYVDNAPRPTPFNTKTKSKAEKDKEEDNEIIKNPISHSVLKQAIDRRMLESFEEGRFNTLYDIESQLKKWGLRIKHQGNNSTSVSHPNIAKNIRLKGYLYGKSFNGMDAAPHNKERVTEQFKQQASNRKNNDLKTWLKGMEMKREYHQSLYGDFKLPKPLELDINSVQHKNKPLLAVEPTIETPKNTYYPRP